jgi:hypothetical protein
MRRGRQRNRSPPAARGGYFVPVPVVPVLLLEPVPVVVSVVLEDEPDVAPGAVVVGAGVVTEPEPETDPLAPGVVVVLGGEADGVRSAAGVSVVRVVLDSVHAVMVRPSARAQKPVTNLFMVMSSLGVFVFIDRKGKLQRPCPPRA